MESCLSFRHLRAVVGIAMLATFLTTFQWGVHAEAQTQCGSVLLSTTSELTDMSIPPKVLSQKLQALAQLKLNLDHNQASGSNSEPQIQILQKEFIRLADEYQTAAKQNPKEFRKALITEIQNRQKADKKNTANENRKRIIEQSYISPTFELTKQIPTQVSLPNEGTPLNTLLTNSGDLIYKSAEGKIEAINVNTKNTQTLFSGEAHLATVTPDGQQVVLYTKDHTVIVIDPANGKITNEIPLERKESLKDSTPEAYNTISISPDGKRVFILGHVFAVFDLASGKEIATQFPKDREKFTYNGKMISSEEIVYADTVSLNKMNILTGETKTVELRETGVFHFDITADNSKALIFQHKKQYVVDLENMGPIEPIETRGNVVKNIPESSSHVVIKTEEQGAAVYDIENQATTFDFNKLYQYDGTVDQNHHASYFYFSKNHTRLAVYVREGQASRIDVWQLKGLK